MLTRRGGCCRDIIARETRFTVGVSARGRFSCLHAGIQLLPKDAPHERVWSGGAFLAPIAAPGLTLPGSGRPRSEVPGRSEVRRAMVRYVPVVRSGPNRAAHDRTRPGRPASALIPCSWSTIFFLRRAHQKNDRPGRLALHTGGGGGALAGSGSSRETPITFSRRDNRHRSTLFGEYRLALALQAQHARAWRRPGRIHSGREALLGQA